LIRRLYKRGYSREDILKLLRLIDWLMALPEELEQELQEALERYEEQEEKKMPYVTSFERIGIKKGIKMGMFEKAQEAVIDVLEIRFQNVPESIIVAVNAIEEPSTLKALHRDALTAASLEEFEQMLDECS